LSLEQRLRGLLRPVLGPAARRVRARLERVAREAGGEGLSVLVATAARGLAAHGERTIVRPALESAAPRPLRIGLVGNIANNAYNFARCLRRLGHDVELVVEDGGFDAFLMNRPAWEDVDCECASFEEGARVEADWRQPAFVRRVGYSPELQQRYQGRLDAVPEVQALYREAFDAPLLEDAALVLAQQMGHWPLLRAMARYDVVQLSGAPISMGPFSPRPYVVFPTGSDLFIAPFEEGLFGLLTRAGYRGARHLLVCETNYFRYLDRLGAPTARTFAPMMIDTDSYAPGDASPLRDAWARQSGGRRFAVQVCRQAWEWKGNDRLLRGFARVASGPAADWRLVLLAWGQDLERSRALVAELGLADRVLWEPLCSKPRLRLRQQAADVVLDAFAIEGYGTSVLESMAAARPVLIRPVPEDAKAWFDEPPPFLGASDEEEIAAFFAGASEAAKLEEEGIRSRRWVEAVHGHASVSERYLAAWDQAFGRSAEARP